MLIYEKLILLCNIYKKLSWYNEGKYLYYGNLKEFYRITRPPYCRPGVFEPRRPDVKDFLLQFEFKCRCYFMIIEGAFLKLPEILLNSSDPHGLYEANIANLFAMGVLLELNARNIDNPLRRIQLERRFGSSSNFRVDIFLDFSGLFNENIGLSSYGVRPYNWVEAKYFGSLGRNKGNETKSENAGSLMFDIFRLCVLPPFTEDKPESHSCYVLNIFNNNPCSYLAMARQDGSKRLWLEELLKPGINKLMFSLSKEPPTIKKVFGAAFLKKEIGLDMEVTLVTNEFKPFLSYQEVQYWGYLSRITEYKIHLGNRMIEYSDYTPQLLLQNKNEFKMISELAASLIKEK